MRWGRSQLPKQHPHQYRRAVSAPGPRGLEGGRSGVPEGVYGGDTSLGRGPSGQLKPEALQPHAEADG